MSIDDILLLKDNQVCCFRGIMPNGKYLCEFIIKGKRIYKEIERQNIKENLSKEITCIDCKYYHGNKSEGKCTNLNKIVGARFYCADRREQTITEVE